MQAEDHAAIAAIWHEGWHDAHAGLVPDLLTATRTFDAFVTAVPKLTKTVLVGCIDDRPQGFAALESNDIGLLFLARTARGTGLAQALMRGAEAALADLGYTDATLDYVKGNARAARFYAREGWRITGEEEDQTDIDGVMTPPWTLVLCRKSLTAD